MVGLIIGEHVGTVMEGTVREGIIRPMGTSGVVTLIMGPRDKKSNIKIEIHFATHFVSLLISSFLTKLIARSREIRY